MKTLDEIRKEIRLAQESLHESIIRQREAERNGDRRTVRNEKCQIGYVQRHLRQLAHEAERAFG